MPPGILFFMDPTSQPPADLIHFSRFTLPKVARVPFYLVSCPPADT
jgi:hypothetical protein